jgi:hypothetical protein
MPLTPFGICPIPEDFAPNSRPRGRRFRHDRSVQWLPMARPLIARSALQDGSGRSCRRGASAPCALTVLELGANEDVDRAGDLLLSSLADLAQGFVDGVLDGLRAKSSPGSAERLIVNVDQMLAHSSPSVYTERSSYIPNASRRRYLSAGAISSACAQRDACSNTLRWSSTIRSRAFQGGGAG